MDLENTIEPKEKLKLPKSVFLIIINEFCERFSFYGMRTILSIYLRQKLDYAENTALVIYHSFAMLVYFFPLGGAIIADSLLGRYRTIFYLSLVYILGQLVISVAAITTLNLPMRELTIIGLLLIAVGTGGIKPCVSAFGGDQFILPQQARYLALFFSMFYFAINFGSTLSSFLTPILRQDITCFGENTCYSLAFFVPCILMIVSVVVFVAGKSFYRTKEPQGNVVSDVVKCTFHALSNKIRSKKGNREHWLDHADDKFDAKMISDMKDAFSVLYLFIPLPLFWALFDQQGSRWTFQAANMNGEIGSFTLKPDQMQVVNPLLILVFIPLFEAWIYPLLHKVHLATPLRKLTLGGLLAGFAFVISALVEINLEKTYPVLPEPGLGQLRIYNSLNCPLNVQVQNESFVLNSLDVWKKTDYSIEGNRTLDYSVSYENCQDFSISSNKYSGSLLLTENNATSFVATGTSFEHEFEESVDRSTDGQPIVRSILNIDKSFCDANNCSSTVEYFNTRTQKVIATYNITTNSSNVFVTPKLHLDSDTYMLRLSNGNAIVGEVPFKLGGVYTMIGHLSKQVSGRVVQITQPNSMHMLWLVPQYVVMTMGEVMFSVTGLEFAFTQAPESMKSLLQAAWLLTVAFGNFIVVIVAEFIVFKRLVFEFTLYAALMFLDMIIFALMARFYKYVEPEQEEDIIEDLPLSDNIGAYSPSLVDHKKH